MKIEQNQRIRRIQNRNIRTILFCLTMVSFLIACSKKHTEKIQINSRKSIFFISEVWGVGGGHYNFKITTNRYFYKDKTTIDFGDIGDLPILYELRNNKLIIYTDNKELERHQMPDFVYFIIYDNEINYVQKLDSVRKGLIENVKIFYPMSYFLN